MSRRVWALASSLCCLSSGCEAPAATEVPAARYADLGITLTNIADEDVSLTSTTGHDVHVLMFWATWCACIGELTELQRIYVRLRERGLHVYAISVDGPNSISRVPGIAAQQKWTFPVLYDPDTRLLASYTPKGEVPFYVILDADGNILKSHQGYTKGDFVAFEEFLVERLPPIVEP